MPTPIAAQVLGCSFALLTPLWEGDEEGTLVEVLGGDVNDAGNELLVSAREVLFPSSDDVANGVDVLEDGDLLVRLEALLEEGDIVGMEKVEELLKLVDGAPWDDDEPGDATGTGRGWEREMDEEVGMLDVGDGVLVVVVFGFEGNNGSVLEHEPDPGATAMLLVTALCPVESVILAITTLCATGLSATQVKELSVIPGKLSTTTFRLTSTN